MSKCRVINLQVYNKSYRFMVKMGFFYIEKWLRIHEFERRVSWRETCSFKLSNRNLHNFYREILDNLVVLDLWTWNQTRDLWKIGENILEKFWRENLAYWVDIFDNPLQNRRKSDIYSSRRNPPNLFLFCVLIKFDLKLRNPKKNPKIGASDSYTGTHNFEILKNFGENWLFPKNS